MATCVLFPTNMHGWDLIACAIDPRRDPVKMLGAILLPARACCAPTRVCFADTEMRVGISKASPIKRDKKKQKKAVGETGFGDLIDLLTGAFVGSGDESDDEDDEGEGSRMYTELPSLAELRARHARPRRSLSATILFIIAFIFTALRRAKCDDLPRSWLYGCAPTPS
jgi:hypothetical protein